MGYIRIVDHILGALRRRNRRSPDVYFFAAEALARRGDAKLNIYEKVLLDTVLVLLIIALVWTGLRSWMQHRDNDQRR